MAEYKLSYTASEIDAKLGQIDNLATNKLDASELDSAIDAALAEAKASGEFDGKTPIKGTDYFTPADKTEIANEAAELVDIPDWAKEPNKPTYTASEVGAAPVEHNHDDAYDAKGSAENALTSANEYTDEYMAVVEEVLTQTMMILYGEENWEKFLEGEMLSVPEMAIPVIAEAFTYHNNDGSVHSDIRELIKGLTTRLNTLANSDDTTLDQLSEIVAYIKSNKSLIDSITTSKVSVSDIVDNLTSSATNKPLSAAQGKALKALIDNTFSGDYNDLTNKPTNISTFTNDAHYIKDEDVVDDLERQFSNRPLSSRMGWILKNDIDTLTKAMDKKLDGEDVFDNLDSLAMNRPLSANQGRVLKEMIDDITVPTKTSQLTNDSGFLTQHQDISGKADKSQGIFYIEGDSSSTTDTTNKVATWIGSHDEITEYFNGLTILYKVVTAGSTTTTLNINGLGAATVVRNATTGISTACPVDGILLLTYTVDSSGTAYWKTADYDANTKNTAGTSNKTGTKLYLVGGGSQSSSGVTTYTNSNIYIDTSNVLNSGKGFKGALVGNADTATKATQDSDGNVIADTYETKADATAMYEQLSAEIDAKLGVIENGSY